MAKNHIFDDELRVKKVFSKIQRAAKSPYNYKNKKTYSSSNHRSKEVVVKIIGASTNLGRAKAHIDYISRKNTLEIAIDEDYTETYIGKEETDYFKDILADSFPKKEEIRGKEKREMLHMTFSMKGKLDRDKLEPAVMQTMREKYPDNFSAFVFHQDTDNHHVHVVLSIRDSGGKRIDVRKKDLMELRKNFAKNLRARGIEAEATFRKDFENKTKEQKSHHYEVVDFGHAKYKFSEDKDASDSFYVGYKTKSGEITYIWSNDLERVVKENNVRIGEFARFKIVGKESVTVTAKKTVGSKVTYYQKHTHRSVWDCSVVGREKELPDPPKVKTTYEAKETSTVAEFKQKQREREQAKSHKRGKSWER